MSSGGQIVGGLVGGVIGFFNPALGWAVGAQVGMMLGGLLDPPKGPTVSGPRLGDLTIQTATYGAVIPRLYGAQAITGNIFWLENNQIKETVKKKKSGGKGAPETTTKTYVNYATFAVGLCKGPIVGVRRIWIKGELYYDAGSLDPETMDASAAAASGFRIYKGDDTQLPDTRMQATLGADTPAYRGLAYIVFYDLPLAKYGESLVGAQVKVEVFCAGDIGPYSRKVEIPRLNGSYYESGVKWDQKRRMLFAVGTQAAETTWSYDGGYTWEFAESLNASIRWRDICLIGDTFFAMGSYDNAQMATSKYIWGPWSYATGPGGASISWRDIIQTADGTVLITSGQHFGVTTDGLNFSYGTWGSSYILVGQTGCHNGTVFCIPLDTFSDSTPLEDSLAVSQDGLSWTLCTTTTAFTTFTGVAASNGRLVAVGISGGVPCSIYSDDDGATWSDPPLAFAVDGGEDTVWRIGGNDIGGFCALPATDTVGLSYWYGSQDGILWTKHKITAVNGTGRVYGEPTWIGHSWGVISLATQATPSYFTELIPALTDIDTVKLSTIVSAECLQSGILTAADIDVTDLTSDVRGYMVASIGSIRAALTQPQAAWPFDVIQSGYQVVFRTRGGASVATIPMTDLDARSAGTAPGTQLTISREMDTQIARRVTIKHLDYDREYDVGEQYAERLNTDSVNEETQDLAIVLTAAEAAGKAEVLLYLRWLERYDVSFNLPPIYNHLEPSDVVTIATADGDILLRLTAINYTSDSRLECRAKYASQSVYAPVAFGVSPVISGAVNIPFPGASFYVLLDVPYMHPAQADPVMLVAMTGRSQSWPGGVLVRTDDAGTTWNDLQAFDTPGDTIATATNTIGSADFRVWDKASTLNVTMVTFGGTLSSATELAVLNGDNYFAYGDHGRWEIIGVQNCVLTSANNYTLYDMLRGRRGTEWAMTLHQAGDYVIPLNTTNVTAVGMASALIGLSREYRGITFGADISSDTDRSFTYTGVNLECLSPVYFWGYKTVSTSDWNLTWVRRSRTDPEWRDAVDAGLGETTEAYEVDIYADGTFATVKRTITAVIQSCTYTSAQQVTDFGSNQATIYAKVYQLSSVVGRGYPATATIS